jgi:hypothetical protein
VSTTPQTDGAIECGDLDFFFTENDRVQTGDAKLESRLRLEMYFCLLAANLDVIGFKVCKKSMETRIEK